MNFGPAVYLYEFVTIEYISSRELLIENLLDYQMFKFACPPFELRLLV